MGLAEELYGAMLEVGLAQQKHHGPVGQTMIKTARLWLDT